MRVAHWIPGIGQWRRGEKGQGMALFALFVLFVGIVLWRHAVMWKCLEHTFHKLSGTSVPYMERHLDFLLSTLFVFLGLVAVNLASWRSLVRSRTKTTANEARRRRWHIVWRQFKRNRLAMTGIVLVLALFLVAILCPLLAPHHPDKIDLTESQTPSLEHPLGTDNLGADVLSRILYGSRISLLVGLLSVALAVTIGTIYGAVSGFYGGRVDSAMMRVADILLAIPTIVLIITIRGLWRNDSIWIIIAVIGFLSWMGVARLVRGQFLALKERDFYLAAKALGAGTWRLIFVHLLPNALTPIIVSATLRVGNTILLEAALSYLGLGVKPPKPSWGNIIIDSKGAILTQWWIPLSAMLAIALTVVAYNLVGDGLRDALDPRLRKHTRHE